ncbi:MAG: nitroreductase family protein, partial [Rhodobacteraceae bacterium]|nr:nitroreductase family protein [Paracoccaceae bacterium]
MTQPNPVFDFLLTRRSRPAAALKLPAPDPETLNRLLTAASRVPDHGKLEPWRFLVIDGAAKNRLSALVRDRGTVLGVDPEKVEKSAKSWANAPLIVAVVSSPKPSDKVPPLARLLSADGVCLSLVNAALAIGWGAAWI